jgi:beta-glucosidase/6-phospho-beta-glucosidase/beta-galactosidase
VHVTRRHLDDLTQPLAFEWLAGIEDTFITAPSPRTGRTLDEYELTGHYDRWREDVERFAELGLRAVRYGIPWHRINPAPGAWDFGWADGPLERLLELGIQPVVDLVHYGLPAWIEGAYLHPDFAERMAEYAARVAERYRGRIHTYTPLNEPRITAWYCGRLGWWPPFRRGWRGFAQVMLAVCRGIVRAVEAMRQVDPGIVHAHVDATDLVEAATPDLAAEAQHRQALVFLALDLVTGRVRAGHPLHAWLLAQGAAPAALDWFEGHAIALDLVGINLYPMFSRKQLVRARRGLRVRLRYADGELVERLAELYWARYRRPLFISETASVGAVRRRLAWLDESVAAVRRLRARGLPLVGYTWWPLYALVTWGYREGHLPPERYLRQMGLWDLRPGDPALERVRTPLVDHYRALVAGGAAAVGPLVSLDAAAAASIRSSDVP